jgi:hypothetical protein
MTEKELREEIARLEKTIDSTNCGAPNSASAK